MNPSCNTANAGGGGKQYLIDGEWRTVRTNARQRAYLRRCTRESQTPDITVWAFLATPQTAPA